MLKVLKEEYYVRRWSVSEGTRPKGEFNRERALIPHQNRATQYSPQLTLIESLPSLSTRTTHHSSLSPVCVRATDGPRTVNIMDGSTVRLGPLWSSVP